MIDIVGVVGMISRLRTALAFKLWPLLLGFAVLTALVLSRSWIIEDQATENAAIRRSFETERQLLAAMSLLQDAESGQRGYLLTGNVTYLEPYRVAVANMPAALDAVDTLAKPDQARRSRSQGLRDAVNAKLAELDQTIELFESGKRDDAFAVVVTDRGRQLMDAVRSIVDSMLKSENAELESRLARAQRIEDRLRTGSLAMLALVLLIAVYGVWDGRRRLQQIAATNESLEKANSELNAEMQLRQQSEAQTRQLQKMEAIGQMTGGIAHDFNNMLAVIMSAMNLIQRKLARGDTDIVKFVDAASDAATRAANLTARLLAFSRQQPLAPDVVDANRLLSGMSELMSRTLGEAISVETILAGGLWKTHADPSQVENAILNLAVNARDAMHEGGKLTIETANAHLDDAYAATHAEVPAGQYVMIAVTDTGTGMPQDVIAKAFDPFFTTKPVNKGTGLGLSQVFGFVKQSKGHVKIYSEVGSGTTVKIYLPRFFGEQQAPDQQKTPVDLGKVATETILVVEDDARVRASTVSVLGELGYKVVQAGDATEAMQRLHEVPGIDLMFTDIVMPGKSGRKLADEALQVFPTLKVIYTTGFTRNAVVHNGVLDHGVNFLAKPFTMDQLAAKIREVLG